MSVRMPEACGEFILVLPVCGFFYSFSKLLLAQHLLCGVSIALGPGDSQMSKTLSCLEETCGYMWGRITCTRNVSFGVQSATIKRQGKGKRPRKGKRQKRERMRRQLEMQKPN